VISTQCLKQRNGQPLTAKGLLQGYHCSFQIQGLPPIPTKAYVVIPNQFYKDHDDACTNEIFTNAGYAVTLYDDKLEFEFVGAMR
jgi:hypothetical protein